MRVAALLTLALLIGCSGSGTDTSTAGAGTTAAGTTSAGSTTGSGNVCTPGQSVACVGVGGCPGGQVCAPDGQSFGACQCGSSTSTAASSTAASSTAASSTAASSTAASSSGASTGATSSSSGTTTAASSSGASTGSSSASSSSTGTSSGSTGGPAPTASLPVAPTASTWMWQGQQAEFLTATGAACNVPIALGVGDQAVCFAGGDGAALQCAGAIYTNTYPSAFAAAGETGVDQILISPTFNSATGNAICVHEASGALRCMGDANNHGQFGNGTSTPTASFVPWGVSGLRAIGSGTWDQMCAIDTGNQVYCSGYNFSPTPMHVADAGANGDFWVDTGGDVNVDDSTLLRAGESRTDCHITASGGLVCDGVPVGTAGHVVMGGYVEALPGTPISFGCGSTGLSEPACWLEDTGDAFCTSCQDPTPLAPVPYFSGHHVLALGANYYAPLLCAVLDDGSVQCLGSSNSGNLSAPSAPPGSVSISCR